MIPIFVMCTKRHLLLFSLLIWLLTACLGQQKAENLPDSGEITIYTSLVQDQAESYLVSFREQYPNITINLVSDSTGIIFDRLLAEREDPQADVVWALVVTSVSLLEWRELLNPYAPVGLERIEPQFRDASIPPYWVGTDVLMSVICVNEGELEKLGLPMPESWEDLINPEYRGYVVMPNPDTSGTGFMAVSAMQYIFGDGAWDYMDALHENIAYYTRSGSEPCRLVGTGDYPIGVSYGYEGITQQKQGKPVTLVFPREGAGWETKASALINKEDSKLAAKTFLDWSISDSAMKMYARDRAITAAKTDQGVPPGFPADPVAELLDIDISWTAANRQHTINEWLSRYSDKLESTE